MITLSASAHRKLERAVARGWTCESELGPCEYLRRYRLDERARKRGRRSRLTADLAWRAQA